MVLVPATMTLLGTWNWWLPAWLDRLLPTIDAESATSPPPATESTPERADQTPVGAG